MALKIDKVKKLMYLKRINQKDLADLCGVTEAAMSRYLNGSRQPKSETLANMATALGTTSNDLLGLEPLDQSEEILRIVARNAAEIPQAIRMKLIQLLSFTDTDDNSSNQKG